MLLRYAVLGLLFAVLSLFGCSNETTPSPSDRNGEAPVSPLEQVNSDQDPFADDIQSAKNLKRLGLAFSDYDDRHGHLPPGWSIRDEQDTSRNAPPAAEDNKPLLSWRVLILPVIGEWELYAQFHLDEPWDSPHNKSLIENMPDIYRRPGSKAELGMSCYQLIDMEGAMIINRTDRSRGLFSTTYADVTDGLTNTLLVVETNDENAVPWTKPSEYTPDKKEPLAGLRGNHPGSILALFGYGNVHALRDDMPIEAFTAMVTYNGKESVRPEEYAHYVELNIMCIMLS